MIAQSATTSATINVEETTELTATELVARSLDLRTELIEAGKRADELGDDTAEGLARCFETGLNALSVPAEFGGVSDGSSAFALSAWMEITTNLAASDGSLAQNWLTTQLVAREIFYARDQLPESTLREIANMILHKGVRFVASNSETGSPGPVTAQPVAGGVLVNGVKTFNSNSGGGGIANVGIRRAGDPNVLHALIPLDAAGVRQHRNWDNMGQRGTCSQTVTYENVFVPDGWHFSLPPSPMLLTAAFLLHGALVLGIGFGAFDAGVEHVDAANRVYLKRFKSAAEDPLMMRRLGVLSSKLHAALAFQRQVCADIEAASTTEQLKALLIDAFRSKTVSVEAGLEAASTLFDLTGARTTSNSFRFDRFWRNARTFAVHDPVDVLYSWIGAWDLQRQEPGLFEQYGLTATGGI